MKLLVVLILLEASSVFSSISEGDRCAKLSNAFSLITQLKVESCAIDMEQQIHAALNSTSAIEIPTTNTDREPKHVSCVEDDLMGTVAQFAMFKDDNEPVNNVPDRQRLEMKVHPAVKLDLIAEENTTYAYDWWYKLESDLKLASNSRFFHIFQLKPSGRYALLTLTLTLREGLHLRLIQPDSSTDVCKDNCTLLSWPEVQEGQWTNVRVEASYRNDTTGYVTVTLRRINGEPITKVISDVVTYGTSTVRPKWGIYRILSDDFNDVDTIKFQNVQIWKKL